MKTPTWSSTSLGSKFRPSVRPSPRVRKYDGLTTRICVTGKFPAAGGGAPWTAKRVSDFDGVSGKAFVMATELTPGRCSVFSCNCLEKVFT